jgi:hypothetical protein
VFNPKEENALQECKLKISMNIFQYKRVPRSKTKMRRSVARSIIKHFITLGVDPL